MHASPPPLWRETDSPGERAPSLAGPLALLGALTTWVILRALGFEAGYDAHLDAILAAAGLGGLLGGVLPALVKRRHGALLTRAAVHGAVLLVGAIAVLGAGGGRPGCGPYTVWYAGLGQRLFAAALLGIVPALLASSYVYRLGVVLEREEVDVRDRLLLRLVTATGILAGIATTLRAPFAGSDALRILAAGITVASLPMLQRIRQRTRARLAHLRATARADAVVMRTTVGMAYRHPARTAVAVVDARAIGTLRGRVAWQSLAQLAVLSLLVVAAVFPTACSFGRPADDTSCCL